MSFTDEIVGVVEMKSSWRAEREVSNTGVQTKPMKTSDAESQSTAHFEASSQTDNQDDGLYLSNEPDNAKLSGFLHNVEDVMTRALMKNNQSSAFDGFVMSADFDSDLCSALRTLSYKDSGDLSVSSLSWNVTGLTLAASFAKFDHSDWCTHKSSLCTWKMGRRNVTNDQPDTTIELSSCLMTVEFHPTEPALIAGANYNGEVLVWNLAEESDMLLAISAKKGQSHNEPISKVIWYNPSRKQKHYQIISVGFDGKILLWTLDKVKRQLQLSSGSLLSAKSMPRQIKVKSSKIRPEMGVTSISFNNVDDSVYYLGSESGGVFKCTTNVAADHLGGDGEDDLSDPVSLAYKPHQGPVYAVSASPFHRNVFTSCSSDTTLRISSALQVEPVCQIEPASGYLYSIEWSPVRPLVFAVATQSGSLLIYDLKKSLTVPVQTLEASPSKQPVYTLRFNAKQKKQIATGDGAGIIRIWQLCDSLTTEAPSERQQLDSFLNSSNE